MYVMQFIKIGVWGCVCRYMWVGVQVCVLVYICVRNVWVDKCQCVHEGVGVTIVNRFSHKEFSEYILGPGLESKYVQVSVAFNTYPIQIFSTNYQKQTLAMDFVKRSFGSVLESLNKVMLLWSFWLIIKNK